jgi:hypothetical protein
MKWPLQELRPFELERLSVYDQEVESMSIVVNPAEKPFLRDDTILIDSLSVCAHVPCSQASISFFRVQGRSVHSRSRNSLGK